MVDTKLVEKRTERKATAEELRNLAAVFAKRTAELEESGR